ncbi:M61 family metallopeptidase [Adhaeribacter swui]|uniref:M61 family metallopeptidase n=1 Tax=Adhaeribacter swui TaxID=2086471 RepID=A0A7G7G7A4_9BACT|nr:M61 family metallopeptidase [Adhaeribacter swui]QNF33038.1 M61 family metallopeptidase [Adhaeribacter swui]
MIQYFISYTNPLTSFIQIRMVIPALDTAAVQLQLPAWRPGRYELQNFAQKIQQFRVVDAQEQPVKFKKITKDCWQIPVSQPTELTVLYNFYAHQMDAGGSWLDETQLYINPVNCLMSVVGQENQPCQLQLAIPTNWQIACGLKQINQNTLEAATYEELVDSPLIASTGLQHQAYLVNNIPFHVWFQGDCQPDWEIILSDFKKFTQEQLTLFQDFPVTDYHFLNQILPYRFYHGVEHSNSTVITLGPGELVMTQDLYKELLGVSCHELFHTWNIKQIRPAEMMPYDYTGENYFRTGYVAEGITTYYGDYLLARCGVFSVDQYFTELNEVLRKHFDDFGQYHLSVADSSFDLWLDGYKPGIPDRKVSIYHKGCIAALILDLEIRKITANQKSLDDVMRSLWQQFGKTHLGYTEQDYQQLVEAVAGQSLQTYFDEVINGIVPVHEWLNRALNYVGCTLHAETNAGMTEARFGFKTTFNGTHLVVSYIEPNSPAAQVLATDDELVALNGRKIEGNLAGLLQQTETVELTLFRNKMLRTATLVPDSKSYLTKYLVRKLPVSSPAQKENFKNWINQEF